MAIRDFTYDNDGADNEALMRRLFAGELDTYTLEKRYVHADGHPVWVALSVSVVRARR